MHRQRTSGPRLVVLVVAVLALWLAAAVAPRQAAAVVGSATRSVAAPTTQAVVLVSEHGLTLSGPLRALHGKAAPELSDYPESSADRLPGLPARNVFLRGALCRWKSRFAAPVVLTFALPKAIFSGSRLPLFHYAAHAWRRVQRTAVVGRVNTTASATITRPGRYAILLDRRWRVTDEDGYHMVVFTGAIPRTVLRDPQVIAAGSVDDPAVITAVMQVTGSDEAHARSTLRSYDSSTGTPVRVIALRSRTMLLRNWSGTSTVGRWLAPFTGGRLPSPETARRIYALPADNLAIDVTLLRVRRGADLITGVCADMTAVQGYGPWATGGGPQLFGPKLSTYPPPAYDPALTAVVSDLRWDEAALAGVSW